METTKYSFKTLLAQSINQSIAKSMWNITVLRAFSTAWNLFKDQKSSETVMKRSDTHSGTFRKGQESPRTLNGLYFERAYFGFGYNLLESFFLKSVAW